MNKIYIALLFIAIPSIVFAQSTTWKYNLEADGLVTQSGKLPFWFRANQFGSIPSAGTSGSLIGSIFKEYDTIGHKKVEWGAGLEVRGNVGNNSNLTLIQGYLKAKAGIFEFQGGRIKDISGITDSTLSTGSFSISENALGIPKFKVSIPDYYYLPFFNKLFAFKAAYGAGYIGYEPITHSKYTRVDHTTALYEQNELYVRLGRPDWKLNLIGGITHHVIFGDERAIYGPGYDVSPLKGFIYAAIGKTVNFSKVGNHLGSVDVALQYEFDNTRLLVYRQSLYDEGALIHLANIADGINGVSLTNKRHNSSGNSWHKFLFEFVYTANQAGYFNSTYTKSGDENYYNNDEYFYGWSYKGLGLGNPLLNTARYTHDNLIKDPAYYFVNNRLSAYHIGADGALAGLNFTTKLTYSLNYGTFATSPEGTSTSGKHNLPKYGLFGEVNQFSGYLEANKQLKEGYSIGLAVAGDNGDLYYNSLGVLLRLKKSFN